MVTVCYGQLDYRTERQKQMKEAATHSYDDLPWPDDLQQLEGQI